MGTGIDLFLDWENGIWVAGTGIWPLGNEVHKNGNGNEVMRVDSQFFHVLSILKYNFDPFLVSLVMIFVANYNIHSTTWEQAYSNARNSGFSDYACPQVRCTAEYMPGLRYILHLRLQDTLFGVLRKIATARSISVRFSSNFHQMFSSACKIW
jgi:hypothetical protein